MYLGRVTNIFTAEDTGVLAAGVASAATAQPKKELKSSVAPVLAAQAAPAVVAASTAPAVLASTASEPVIGNAEEKSLATEERKRLWGLIGKLREANNKLWKANRRLTKEAESLRSELSSESRITVDSIVRGASTAAESAAELQGSKR